MHEEFFSCKALRASRGIFFNFSASNALERPISGQKQPQIGVDSHLIAPPPTALTLRTGALCPPDQSRQRAVGLKLGPTTIG